MELFSSPGLYFVKNLTVILFLLNRCVQQQVDPIPPNHLAVNGAFITIHEYASKGPKLERRTCRSLLQCGHLCLKNQKCASFNYQTSRVPTGLWELSEASIVSSEEHSKLNKMHGFVFVQIARRDLVRFPFTRWRGVLLCSLILVFQSVCLFSIKWSDIFFYLRWFGESSGILT